MPMEDCSGLMMNTMPTLEKERSDPNYRTVQLKGAYEKRDIKEVAEELGVDLELRGYGDRPYYVGLCPLHEDTTPSFVVYPKVQRFVCYACFPEGGDVYELYKQVTGCTYEEAQTSAGVELSAEKSFGQFIDKVVQPSKIDRMRYAVRCSQLFVLHDFETAQGILQEVDRAMAFESTVDIERLLRNSGV